ILQELAQRRQLIVAPELLKWLAKRLIGGVRQLEGAVVQLQALTKMHRRPLDVETVASHFTRPSKTDGPTLDRVAQRVAHYFRVDSRRLHSVRRSRDIVWPRQVGMYVARELT